MPYLSFGGTSIEIAPNGFNRAPEPRAPVWRENCEGSVVSSITSTQGVKSVWSARTPPMAATGARALRATLASGIGSATASGDLLATGMNACLTEIEVDYQAGGLHATLVLTLVEG